ncbi:MAG: hypothetical protein CVU91_07530 [Firmicutes bacterium HGW-Firmicutes-16]|nr:MAG: hypothetical protein CVU91_07530 [Firmicutes bacterium HGW-Firmicutes-16]
MLLGMKRFDKLDDPVLRSPIADTIDIGPYSSRRRASVTAQLVYSEAGAVDVKVESSKTADLFVFGFDALMVRAFWSLSNRILQLFSILKTKKESRRQAPVLFKATK